jgi:hypothetical protein
MNSSQSRRGVARRWLTFGRAGPGTGPGIIALVGHYDTKLFNDMTFVGANDGGSSAAWVLEMARATEGLRLQNTLEFVFFDGEEAVVEWTDDDSVYGSKHDVDRRSRGRTLQQLKAVILVDMIGDKDLRIERESQSTGWLTETIWSTARSMGYTQEFPNTVQTISDDHIPFLNARIPAVRPDRFRLRAGTFLLASGCGHPGQDEWQKFKGCRRRGLRESPAIDRPRQSVEGPALLTEDKRDNNTQHIKRQHRHGENHHVRECRPWA